MSIYTNDNDPIPADQPLARRIRDLLIVTRNDALGVGVDFDPEGAVECSHLIAAFNTGCIKQVKEYIPSGD